MHVAHKVELQLQPLIDCYDLHCESLKIESNLAKRTLAKKSMESAADVFRELSPSFSYFIWATSDCSNHLCCFPLSSHAHKYGGQLKVQ